jgi:hypothetical protein
LVSDPKEWIADPLAKRMRLQANGVNSLFAKLCGSTNPSSCTRKSKIVLNANLFCSGTECSVDTVRVVEVGNGIFYEYVPLPCVYRAFFQNAKMIVRQREWWDLVCADPLTQVASAACCDYSNDPVGTWADLVSWTHSAYTFLPVLISYPALMVLVLGRAHHLCYYTDTMSKSSLQSMASSKL